MLLQVVWRKGIVPEAWKDAEGICTPKELNSRIIDQFRTISLLNVEGKIFFADLAKRLITFITVDKYINTSVQKGGVPRLSRTYKCHYIAHQRDKSGEDLTVVWLDLDNAYGSIPHQLIYTALQHYFVDSHNQKSITSYSYTDFRSVIS